MKTAADTRGGLGAERRERRGWIQLYLREGGGGGSTWMEIIILQC